MNCLRCNASLIEGASYCSQCGAAAVPGAGAPQVSSDVSFRSPTPALPHASRGEGEAHMEALAIASVILGALAWLTLPLIGAAAAVICGHLARGEIRRSNGRLKGAEFATVGLILGYLQLAIAMLVAVFVLGIIMLGLHASRISL